MRIAQANAEGRQAEAVALYHQMRAKVVENKAALVEAEAEIPIAIALAYRAGHITPADLPRKPRLLAEQVIFMEPPKLSDQSQ
jgi:uncharacterized protein YqfA (UPF0365 family)